MAPGRANGSADSAEFPRAAASANGRPADAPSTGAAQTRRTRWRRDSLRRRLLALADLVAAMGAAVICLPSGTAVFWAAAFLPAWILLAKAIGNYDRDHRAIRQLTMDEIPQLIAWAALGALALTAFLSLTPVGTPAGWVTIKLFLASAAGVVVLRGASCACCGARSSPPSGRW